ncbi:MAG: hypothetical protein DRP75_02460 [Candidatus Omnitrophota bacterium]|nr:MAG: hypothetical protein DRP75_02460 [Candidatus Omnitrophota bacterium]
MGSLKQRELFDIQRFKRDKSFWAESEKREKLIFLFIVLFLTSILLFCLGIERGKRITSGNLPPSVSEVRVKQREKVSKQEVKEEKKSKGGYPEKREHKGIQKKRFFYTVQLASYKTRKYAERELKRLQDYGGYLERQGRLWVLYAGRFESLQEARQMLQKINRKNRYPDALIRKMRKE